METTVLNPTQYFSENASQNAPWQVQWKNKSKMNCQLCQMIKNVFNNNTYFYN